MNAVLVAVNVFLILTSIHGNDRETLPPSIAESPQRWIFTLMKMTDIVTSIAGHSSIVYQSVRYQGESDELTEFQILLIKLSGITNALLLASTSIQCWFTIIESKPPKNQRFKMAVAAIVTLLATLVIYDFGLSKWMREFDGFLLATSLCFVIINLVVNDVITVLKTTNESEKQGSTTSNGDSLLELIMGHILKFTLSWVPFLIFMMLVTVATLYESSMRDMLNHLLAWLATWTFARDIKFMIVHRVKNLYTF